MEGKQESKIIEEVLKKTTAVRTAIQLAAFIIALAIITVWIALGIQTHQWDIKVIAVFAGTIIGLVTIVFITSKKKYGPVTLIIALIIILGFLCLLVRSCEIYFSKHSSQIATSPNEQNDQISPSNPENDNGVGSAVNASIKNSKLITSNAVNATNNKNEANTFQTPQISNSLMSLNRAKTDRLWITLIYNPFADNRFDFHLIGNTENFPRLWYIDRPWILREPNGEVLTDNVPIDVIEPGAVILQGTAYSTLPINTLPFLFPVSTPDTLNMLISIFHDNNPPIIDTTLPHSPLDFVAAFSVPTNDFHYPVGNDLPTNWDANNYYLLAIRTNHLR